MDYYINTVVFRCLLPSDGIAAGERRDMNQHLRENRGLHKQQMNAGGKTTVEIKIFAVVGTAKLKGNAGKNISALLLPLMLCVSWAIFAFRRRRGWARGNIWPTFWDVGWDLAFRFLLYINNTLMGIVNTSLTHPLTVNTWLMNSSKLRCFLCVSSSFTIHVAIFVKTNTNPHIAVWQLQKPTTRKKGCLACISGSCI